VATLIDPPGASFDWEALDMLTAGERMDLMFLFPEDMDLERNARADAALGAGQARLDRYFANPITWREAVRNPETRDLGLALRRRYKADMAHQLGYRHFGREFRVRNSRGGQIYTLCFASKVERGAAIWDSVHKDDPSGQILLPI
jgi:three-Cys-motif partner protein